MNMPDTNHSGISNSEMTRRTELVEPRSRATRLAIADLVLGLLSYRIWTMLAWQEIRQRYRRSVLGPLWLTLSTGIMVTAMGPLYTRLFGQTLNSYFSYLATSIVVWQLISTMIQDSCQAFIGSEGFIKQLKLPLSLYVLRIVWKNLIIFAHNIIVVLIVFLFFPPPFGLKTLMFPVGLALVAANGVWLGIVIGLLCARFRDVSNIVNSVVGVLFFMTPIMWSSKMLGENERMVDFNPFYHLIEVVRGPLLSDELRAISWISVLAITFLGFGFMLFMFSRYRARIAYWI